MSELTILVVDDEEKIIRFISTSLNLAGHATVAAVNGRQALDLFAVNDIDLIILDLGLPDIDGFDVLSEIRSHSTVPVIILTARDGEKDKVKGLQLGADDYLTKPFGTQELKARIDALIRRTRWSPQPTDITEFATRDLLIDTRRRRITIAGNVIHLTPTEYDLLRVLAQNMGHVMSHGELLSTVWGEEYQNDLAILRVNISRLRQKLEKDPRNPEYIVTVSGVGYMMPSNELNSR